MLITDSGALFYYTQILYTASHTDCRASEPLWAAITADADTFYKRPRRRSWLSKLHTTPRFFSIAAKDKKHPKKQQLPAGTRCPPALHTCSRFLLPFPRPPPCVREGRGGEGEAAGRRRGKWTGGRGGRGVPVRNETDSLDQGRRC